MSAIVSSAAATAEASTRGLLTLPDMEGLLALPNMECKAFSPLPNMECLLALPKMEGLLAPATRHGHSCET